MERLMTWLNNTHWNAISHHQDAMEATHIPHWALSRVQESHYNHPIPITINLIPITNLNQNQSAQIQAE